MNSKDTSLLVRDFHAPVSTPPEVQPEWEVYNASRPISGHWTWVDMSGACGAFFAAIDPAQVYAEQYRQRCLELAAFRVVYIPRAAVERWGRARCVEYGMDYDEIDFADIVHSFYVNWEGDKVVIEKLLSG